MLWSVQPAPPQLVIAMLKRLAPMLGVLGLLLCAPLMLVDRDASAVSGTCGTSHDGLDSEEATFLGLVQGWRDQNLANSTDLEVSGALNAAAAWFAQWQVESGAPGGHNDNLGRNWVQRAADCGYPTTYAPGSGEATYAVASSGQLSIGAAEGAAGVVYPGSGVYADTPFTTIPFKCAGAAVYRNAAGTVVAWVFVVAQFPAAQACPGSTGSVPSVTPTATASPTPTVSPTPLPRGDGASVTVYEGWNLAVLPSGDVATLLARAAGCYRSVYQLQPSGEWLRYSPGVPAYANNLGGQAGGTYWIEGTAANCGLVLL